MPEDRAAIASAKQGLHVDFRSVEELFAGQYLFNLPWFQRAYAWTEDLAQRLLKDICQAHIEGANRYFIGHVLLSRPHNAKRHELIDGQQRAVTLMILFALLRSKLAGTGMAERLTPLIEAPGSTDGSAYRLSPQPTIETFFRENIQALDAIAEPDDEFDAAEVERNILNNRQRLDEMLEDFKSDGGNLEALADFLLTRCLLVLEIVEGDEENEAWKMLQTEENTGLPFHNSARAKVTLISVITPEHREQASRMWEHCQLRLGDDGMQQLVTHIRDLSRRQRSSQPVEKDIIKDNNLDTDGLAFMQNRLVPSADRLIALRNFAVGRAADREAISRYLRHINWAGHVYWCPPAMQWLETRGDKDRDTAEFFRLLARKVWLLRIGGADSVEHERRFISLASEIRDNLQLSEMTELWAQDKWVQKTRDGMLSRTFYDKRYSRPMLRYLSDLMGADSGEVDGFNATIEHVLPKKPGKSSRWAKQFSGKHPIRDYAHRIGNLALLSFESNQEVGNSEYAHKRPFLADSGFILSKDAARADQWTPQHVRARTEALTRIVFDHWQLKL